jgi:hypothetical protein
MFQRGATGRKVERPEPLGQRSLVQPEVAAPAHPGRIPAEASGREHAAGFLSESGMNAASHARLIARRQFATG